MMWMLLFTLLPLLGIGYVSWHVWCLLPLWWGWKVLAVVLLFSSFLLMFAGMAGLLDRLPLPVAAAVYEVGTSSVFVLMYLVLIFLVLDLLRLVLHLLSCFHGSMYNILHDNWWTVGAIAVFMVATFLYGNIHYRHKYRQTLTLTTTKPLARPLKVVMASDLHIGYHNTRKELARWVDLINSEQPDVILIGGDIIDMSMRPLREERMHEEFHRLKAPVYACLGNHEYYSGQPDALQFYRDAGIHLLRDSTATVGDLLVIGRDDRTNLRRKPLAEVMKAAGQKPSALYTVVLDHQPHHLEEAEQAGVEFQFSGHTHYGQVWPISWITDAIYECAFGEHRRGHTRYYVSSGLGIWGGKFRIGTRSEYVVATIKPDP